MPIVPLLLVVESQVRSMSPLLCGLAAVHVLCLAAASLARLGEGTRHERIAQAGCLAALGGMGCVCGMSLRCGPGFAAFSGVTLAVMTIVAVADFGASPKAADGEG